MLFQSSIRRELARSFGATLVVLITIVMTIVLIRTLGQASRGYINPQDVMLLMAYSALGRLPTILTLSLFIAMVGTLSRMYRDSEMVIWFASGVSLTRFVRPVLRVSWPVLLVIALLALFVWPWQNERSVALKEHFERRSDLSRVAPGQFQTSSDGTRVFFIDRDATDSRTARNVFILSTLPNSESVTTAHTGHIEMNGDDRFLMLEGGQRNEENLSSGEKSLARFEEYRVQVGERVLPTANDLPPRAQRSIDLLRKPTPRHQGELVWRLGLVLGAANLMLLGIGLSASNPRRANNWNLLFALLSFVVYYNIINLSQAWVGDSKVGMGTALITAHGGALTLALALLWWRENGIRRRGWFRRAAATPSASTQRK